LLSRRLLIAAALACAALAGCGEDDPASPDVPPPQLLEAALAKPVSSGEVQIDASIQLDDSSLLSDPATVELDGPFALRGAAVPRFDLDFDAEVAGYGAEGKLISDGNDGYVVFFGENYRLGTDHIDTADAAVRFAAQEGLRFDPADWIADPRYDGTEEVGGESAHRIEGRLRVAPLRQDLLDTSLSLSLGSPAAVAERLRSGTVTALVAAGDGTLRGLSLGLELAGPGHVDLAMRLSDIGSEQEIERPEGGGFQPVEELLARFERLAGIRIRF
jgi:hypothetical protein